MGPPRQPSIFRASEFFWDLTWTAISCWRFWPPCSFTWWMRRRRQRGAWGPAWWAGPIWGGNTAKFVHTHNNNDTFIWSFQYYDSTWDGNGQFTQPAPLKIKIFILRARIRILQEERRQESGVQRSLSVQVREVRPTDFHINVKPSDRSGVVRGGDNYHHRGESGWVLYPALCGPVSAGKDPEDRDRPFTQQFPLQKEQPLCGALLPSQVKIISVNKFKI